MVVASSPLGPPTGTFQLALAYDQHGLKFTSHSIERLRKDASQPGSWISDAS